jgi:3-hydroxybutyryl-CoA dehydrogenase
MKIAIAGAGLMGSGIAISSILAGYETCVYDLNDTAITKSREFISKDLTQSVEKGRISSAAMELALSKLSYATQLSDLKADLIIEAVLEKLEIKQKLFADLELINGEDTILATNTSSIPVTQIAAGLTYPGRVVGVHFFNPAQVMKLVEIISGVATNKEVAEKAFNWAVSLGKKAVYAKDAPGFIVNRVARHYYVEALKLLEEEVTDLETIDRLCESAGFKMGPFKLMDLIGVETNFSVTSSMYEQFHGDPKFRPNRIQQQKVYAGHFGRKTGKGFYDYEK